MTIPPLLTTTLEYQAQISQLERERDALAAQLHETQSELRCALAGLTSMHQVLLAGAQLRLQMLAEIERLERERARAG